MGHETIIGVQKPAREKNVSHAFSTAVAYPELWIRVSSCGLMFKYRRRA
jgi:hypothetical protein